MKRNIGFKLLNTILVSGVIFIFCGCGSSLPNESKIKEDLVQQDLDISSVEDIKNLTINEKQDNKKENKTAVYNISMTCNDNKRKCETTVNAKINYEFYDQGGWKIKDIIFDKASVKEKPNFKISDDELMEKLKEKQKRGEVIKYKCDKESRVINGSVSKDDESSRLESGYDINYEIMSNEYNEEDGTVSLKTKVVIKTATFEITQTCEGEVVFNYPNWTIGELTPIEQHVDYIIPSEVKEATFHDEGKFNPVTKTLYSISMNKDSEGKYSDGEVKIRIKDVFGKDEVVSAYKVKISYTKNNTLQLKAQDGSNINEMYDIELYVDGSDVIYGIVSLKNEKKGSLVYLLEKK